MATDPSIISLDHSKSALITLDIQPAIFELGNVPPVILSNISRTVNWARERGMTVIHVATGFEDGHPELPQNLETRPALGMWARIKANNMMLKSHPNTAVHPDIFKQNDRVVWKTRTSAFFATDIDLNAVLKELDVETIVLLGVATNGAVLSTVRSAWDLDWKMIVVKDACWDRDQELHDCLMTKSIPGRAQVVSIDDLTQL